MCWMAVHSFTASHEREGQHTKRYAQCTQGMSQKSMEKQLSCVDGYSGKSTKDTTHERRTKGHAGVTVAFTSNMQLTMSKA